MVLRTGESMRFSGKRFEEVLHEKGLNQSSLSRRLLVEHGVTVAAQSIGTWINGHVSSPRSLELIAAARCLGVDVSVFFVDGPGGETDDGSGSGT